VLEGAFKDRVVHPSCNGQEHLSLDQVAPSKAPSNLTLNTSKDGAFKTSLGNLLQCLIILIKEIWGIF